MCHFASEMASFALPCHRPLDLHAIAARLDKGVYSVMGEWIRVQGSGFTIYSTFFDKGVYSVMGEWIRVQDLGCRAQGTLYF